MSMSKYFLVVCLVLVSLASVFGNHDWSADQFPERWNTDARNTINKVLNRKLNGNIAKNIIFFLGDGMGISTVTAGRIRKGQIKDRNGEEEITYMESLPHLALSKTYNIDAQTPDSAGTATAYLSGVKTRIGVIGLDGRAVDCPTSLNSKVESILKWAHFAGKSTGIVTTTRVTHATPSGCYAHVPFRDWEAYDGKYFGETESRQGCKDIAAQLIEDNNYINLVMGGGRKKFMRRSDPDYFKPNAVGDRIDGKNLIDNWHSIMQSKQRTHKFIWNITEFNKLQPNQYEHVLALLNHDHMDYEADRIQKNPIQEPSIIDMTEKAIQLLSTNPKGYFLLVEGGKIDHAHHESNAHRALDDFAVFDESIGEALKMTDEKDTLVVVTADHSHVFTMGGYSNRGNSLFGINLAKEGNLSDVNLTYTALLYGNGPGAIRQIRTENLTSEQTENLNYKQESAVYLNSETHGGEDVAIFARGPMSYLFDGTVEQSYIAHAMAYSACVGPYNSTKFIGCAEKRGVYFEQQNSTPKLSYSTLLVLFSIIINIISVCKF